MADTHVREGTVGFKIQQVDTPYHTYYKIIGDISSNSPRLAVVQDLAVSIFFLPAACGNSSVFSWYSITKLSAKY
jgi:hypothetical protein